jgi:uncharacterized membrane protein
LRVKLGTGLLLTNLLSLVLVVVILVWPSNAARIVLGIPFVLFLPGYALMAALFPGREGLSGLQRVALSFGISIAVVPLIGFVLNYTPWGIRLIPSLLSIVSFIVLASVIAWLRQKRLSGEEQLNIGFQLELPRWGESWWDRGLYVAIIVVVVGALAALGYAVAKPKIGERFTEFYILGPSGEAKGYPGEIRIGEEAEIIAVVVNREHETVSYRLEVKLDGVNQQEVEGIVLEHEQEWEETVNFTSGEAGDDQKVEFFLYKNSETEPTSSPLHLWIDVISGVP